MHTKIVLGLLVLLVALSCHREKKVMNKEELLKHINHNEGLTKIYERNGIQVKLQYRPSSLLVAQELETGLPVKEGKLDSLQKKYSGNYYFLLTLSKDGKEAIRQLGGFEQYSDLLSVLSFEMPRFVNLTTPRRDTVPLSDFLFEPTYGLSDGNRVMLAFSKERLTDIAEVQINLAECGLGTGNLRFSFRKEDLTNVPLLKNTYPINQ